MVVGSLPVSARGPGLGIGEVTKLFGVTQRALRFYEERGLIHAVRDRQNCRRYDCRTRATLELIARLRRAGMSIPHVRLVLEARELGYDARGCAHRLIAAQREGLRRQLAELDGLENWLDSAPATTSDPPELIVRPS